MPMQKEIIHLAVGTLSHHVSAHFFNQQSSHFQYSDSANGADAVKDEHPLILDPSVDFQEGIGTRRSESTFFPRQIVIDFNDAIGTRWDAYDVVFDEEAGDAEPDDLGGVLGPSTAANEGLNAWNSLAEVQRVGWEGKVKNTRTIDLSDDDEEWSAEDEPEPDDSHSMSSEKERRTKRPTRRPRKRRNPAEYAHNPSHPRSLRPLPSIVQSGSLVPMSVQDHTSTSNASALSTFEMGMSLFRHMDAEESLLDENIRWFAEESDQMQSFSLCTSTYDGFAGMTHEVMQLLADEYSKVPVVAWGADLDLLRGADVEDESSIERFHRLRKTNNVLSLWSLASASLFTPMSLPRSILDGRKRLYSSRVDWSDPSNVGAFYAAHIDTVTLTSRLHDQSVRRPLSSLAASLNWRRNTPIASLSGCMPTPLLAPVSKKERRPPIDPIEALLASRGYGSKPLTQSSEMSPDERAKYAAQAISDDWVALSEYDVDESRCTKTSNVFAQSITGRDDARLAQRPTQDALEFFCSLDEPAGRVDVVPLAFNVRSASFPQLFRHLTSDGRPVPPAEDGTRSRERVKVNSIPMLASISTTPKSTRMLDEARRWVDDTLVKGHEPLFNFGIGGARGRSSAGQASNEETEGLLGGRDGLMEIRESLEELLGAYEEGLPFQSRHVDDAVGTDEEFEGGKESDWDLN